MAMMMLEGFSGISDILFHDDMVLMIVCAISGWLVIGRLWSFLVEFWTSRKALEMKMAGLEGASLGKGSGCFAQARRFLLNEAMERWPSIQPRLKTYRRVSFSEDVHYRAYRERGVSEEREKWAAVLESYGVFDAPAGCWIGASSMAAEEEPEEDDAEEDDELEEYNIISKKNC